MRFQATHPAMKLLALIGTPISSAEARKFLHEDRTANKRYNDADRQKVNWSSIEYVAHPVAYEFYLLKSSPWTWHGILVFDYPNQTGYVQALGD